LPERAAAVPFCTSNARVASLPGVSGAERRGDDIVLACGDADRALRALIASHAEARNFEVTGVRLEDAFIALTSDDAKVAATNATITMPHDRRSA
jgi:ABC-2 type transport system ATP-binding protein